MAKNDVIITINAKDKASAVLKKVSGAMDELGITAKKSGEGAEDFGTDWAMLLLGLNQGMQIVQQVGQAIQASFDFTREGAAVIQMEAGFSSMMKTIGSGTDVLKSWNKAAGGTISKMDLMSGFLTATAGLSAKATQAFEDNYESLIRISKAASAMNPKLGDTAFMLQSITRGLKRQQPKLIDNLGLQLKLSEANKKYAETVGKTTEELTAEEEQMALLNATLEAGDRLITQLGGSVEAATDPWDHLTSSIKNAIDEASRSGAVFGVVFEKVATMIDNTTGNMDEHGQAWADLDDMVQNHIITEEEMYALIRDVGGVTKLTAADVMVLALANNQTAIGFGAVEGAAAAAKAQMQGYDDAIGGVIEGDKNLLSLMGRFSGTMEDVNEKQQRLNDLLELQQDRGYGVYEGVWYSASKLEEKIGDVRDGINNMKDTMSSAAAQMVLDLKIAQLTADDGIFSDEDFAKVQQFGLNIGIYTKAGVQEALRQLEILNKYELSAKYVNVNATSAWV